MIAPVAMIKRPDDRAIPSVAAALSRLAVPKIVPVFRPGRPVRERLADILASGSVDAASEIAQELAAQLGERLAPVLEELLSNAVAVGFAAAGRTFSAHRPVRKQRSIQGLAVDNPEALAFVQSHAGQLVTGVTDGVRSAIRDIIVRGWTEHLPPLATRRGQLGMASVIESIIGLTSSQERAVSNFLSTMRNAGLAEDIAQEKARQYAKKLLKSRAETIARTETLRGVNMGQQLLWERLVFSGVIPLATRRLWVTTPDERTCPICQKFDGIQVSIHQEFSASVPRIGRENVTITSRVPPLHPACRCTMALVVGA